MTKRTALITGITGQDGSYLAELLLSQGYQVVGLTRNISAEFSINILHLKDKIQLVHSNYDFSSLLEIIERFKPSEIFNLAGQVYVVKSWEMLEETYRATAKLPCDLLEAIVRTDRSIKFFQASSSEVFAPSDALLTEVSPMGPSNPYGCSKLFAQTMVSAYRQKYGIYAVTGTLFNHESPRRHVNFLGKKIIRTATRIKLGLENSLTLGNLELIRDLGYAPEYADAIARMMHMDRPHDLLICTGEKRSLEDFVRNVFEILELDYKKYLIIDKSLFRPFEPALVCGSNQKAKELIGWGPAKSFEQMLQSLVKFELRIQRGEEKNFSNERPFH